MLGRACSPKGQARSWLPVGKTEFTLVKELPIHSSHRRGTAYIKMSTDKAGGGVTNTGYWGIPVQKDQEYQLAVIIQSEPSGNIRNEVRTMTTDVL